MARERKYELDKQTHFAKTHRAVMKDHYMTDIDSLQIINTENQVYQQYTYINSIPMVRRIIEVKSRMSKSLQYMFDGTTTPNAQVKSQAYMVAEINAFRRQTNYPQMEYYYVVQDLNEYPYSIWNVTTTFGTGAIQFKEMAEVHNDKDFQAFFSTST
tara:strand:- start:679 stop:1149 length:471 start_codon:yes stop_codon:yes gene_type:complete